VLCQLGEMEVVSPYLLRPLRSLEQAMKDIEENRKRWMGIKATADGGVTGERLPNDVEQEQVPGNTPE